MNTFNWLLVLVVSTFLLSACASKPYATSNKIYRENVKNLAKIISSQPKDTIVADSIKYPKYWAGTTNFNLRKPHYVIIHHTAQKSCKETINTFIVERTQVSAHYVICKDGTLHHMLNDYFRAWHAGLAKWGNVSDINSASIGIELDNNGKDNFTEAQLNTLLGLLNNLKITYNIPPGNFIGHGDIAPGRKVDPNVTFPWKRLADNGFGYWYDDTTNIRVPADFNSKSALKIIGYDISKELQVTEAFRRHFLQTETQGELSGPELKILYILMQKYL